MLQPLRPLEYLINHSHVISIKIMSKGVSFRGDEAMELNETGCKTGQPTDNKK